MRDVTVKRKLYKRRVRVCNHCRGTLRYYRGSHTCLMCGRDVDHECDSCKVSLGLLAKTG